MIPGQLDLLRQFGPYSTDTRVWVEDDPEPVIESTESLDGNPASPIAWKQANLTVCDTPLKRLASPIAPWCHAAPESGRALTLCVQAQASMVLDHYCTLIAEHRHSQDAGRQQSASRPGG
jgi:hypothetical protein